MSELRLAYPASVIAGKPRIVPDDIVFLRMHMFPDGLLSAHDAAQLLAIHKSCPDKCVEWDNWFIEMMTAFIVFHSWPQNSLDEINARWITDMFSRDGVIETRTELELVLHIIEVSRDVPEQLSVLALHQLRLAVESGEGAYAKRRLARRNGVTREDIDYLYRVLRGSLHQGKMMLGEGEIYTLEAIDRSVSRFHNHPAWRGLVSAIGKRTRSGEVNPGPWLRMLEQDFYRFEDAA